MTALRRKLNSGSGAVLIIALVVFLVCAMVGSVVLTASTVNAGRMSHLKEEYQGYLTLRSAAELLREELESVVFTADVTTITHSVCSEGTSTSGQNFAAQQGGDLKELTLEMATEVCKNGYETSKELTMSFGDLEDVTVSLKMDKSYNITALLSCGENKMTLQVPGQQTKLQKETKTETHQYKVYDQTEQTCTKETDTDNLTVTWNGGTIEKGAGQ